MTCQGKQCFSDFASSVTTRTRHPSHLSYDRREETFLEPSFFFAQARTSLLQSLLLPLSVTLPQHRFAAYDPQKKKHGPIKLAPQMATSSTTVPIILLLLLRPSSVKTLLILKIIPELIIQHFLLDHFIK